jgi:hypothetical protein
VAGGAGNKGGWGKNSFSTCTLRPSHQFDLCAIGFIHPERFRALASEHSEDEPLKGVVLGKSAFRARRVGRDSNRVSVASSEDEVSARLIAMAQEYRVKADAMEADSKPMPSAAGHSGSRHPPAPATNDLRRHGCEPF